MKNHATVADFLDDLVLKGQYHFTLKEVEEALSIKQASLSVSLSRLAKKGKLKMIRKGFGIITGHTRGIVHPSYFVNAMMSHLGSRYYVGLLSAASHWGASHQSAMVYYIVAEKVIKPISVGQLRIEFITKNNFDEISETKSASGSGGYYLVSSPELTAIDLLRFPKKSGHLNNIATILEDLIEKIDAKKLVFLCKKSSTPTATIQRLGYILDEVLQQPNEAELINKVLSERKITRVLLSISKKESSGKFSKFPFNERWGIYQNTTVEPD